MLSVFMNFALMHFIFVISPGASFVYLIGNGLKYGIKIATYALLGTAIGYGLIAGLAVVGAIEILEIFPKLNQAIGIVGSLYLFYKAIQIWKNASNINESSFTVNNETAKHSTKKLLKTGFKVSLTNPQVGINILALVAMFSEYQVGVLQRFGIWLWLTLGYLVYFYAMLRIFTNSHIRKIIMPKIKLTERIMSVMLAILSVRMFYSFCD